MYMHVANIYDSVAMARSLPPTIEESNINGYEMGFDTTVSILIETVRTMTSSYTLF